MIDDVKLGLCSTTGGGSKPGSVVLSRLLDLSWGEVLVVVVELIESAFACAEVRSLQALKAAEIEVRHHDGPLDAGKVTRAEQEQEYIVGGIARQAVWTGASL